MHQNTHQSVAACSSIRVHCISVVLFQLPNMFHIMLGIADIMFNIFSDLIC